MTGLKAVHQSLCFDVGPQATVNYLVRLIHTHDPDLLTCTEAYKAEVARRLRRQLGAKTYAVGRRGEYLCVWRRTKIKQTLAGRLTKLTHVAHLADWLNFRIGVFTFTCAGQLLRVDIAHTPSGVEMGDSWNRANPHRIPAHQNGMETWGQRGDTYLSRHPKGRLIQVADFNVDQKRSRWRRYVRDNLGGISILTARMPHHGTHGGRLIDSAQVHRATPTGCWVPTTPARPAGMDHRPIVYTINL